MILFCCKKIGYIIEVKLKFRKSRNNNRIDVSTAPGRDSHASFDAAAQHYYRSQCVNAKQQHTCAANDEVVLTKLLLFPS
jgi:hypothetical protein